MSHKFLNLPIRRFLNDVSATSLSVRWVLAEGQSGSGLTGAEQLSLLDLGEQDRWPALHSVGERGYPIERFYARLDRRPKKTWPAGAQAEPGT